MDKVFVLDTNVLLIDHQAMFKFSDNAVYIPMVVLEELDNFKGNMDNKGYHARETARLLDSLSRRGNLKDGVTLNNGGKLFVKETEVPSSPLFKRDTYKPDHLIIQCAKNVEGIIISRDINVRLKARGFGIDAEDHNPKELREDNKLYTGTKIIDADQIVEDASCKKGKYHKEDIKDLDIYANQYCHFSTDSSGGKLTRFNKAKQTFNTIKEYNKGVMTIKAKNKEQRYALDALLDPNISLVTLTGIAGSGKTLLSVAAGLKSVLFDELYNKIIVSRPVMTLGKDIGYLPGSIEEKMNPYIQPIYDNIDFLFEENRTKGSAINKMNSYSVDQLFKDGVLQIEPLTYIRGRTISKQYMIVDEVQNLSPHEIKTILTRAGEGTKIILTGDIDQIDSPYLDKNNNGLTYVINKFRDKSIAAHITLVKGERSKLAELASKIL